MSYGSNPAISESEVQALNYCSYIFGGKIPHGLLAKPSGCVWTQIIYVPRNKLALMGGGENLSFQNKSYPFQYAEHQPLRGDCHTDKSAVASALH